MIGEQLRKTAQRLAYWTGISALRVRQSPGLRVIMFHGVGGSDYPVERLEEEISFLKRLGPILRLEEVEEVIYGRPFKGSAFLLTFDDGLRNNCSHAYPVLKALDAPATYFICPGLIESGSWLWNCEARERLRSLAGNDLREFCLEFEVNASSVEDCIDWMKSVPGEKRSEAERWIRALTPDFEADAEQDLRFAMSSWEDLTALDPDLVSFGSHTMSHPILTTLPAGEVERELVESRVKIESMTGRKVWSFCYPNGRLDKPIRELVARHYRLAFTTVPGLVPGDVDPYRIPRIGGTPVARHFAWRLHRPRS